MLKIYENPERNDWNRISERPSPGSFNLKEHVQSIIDRVAREGDSALLELTEQYDQVRLNDLKVTEKEIALANDQVEFELKDAIQTAKRNIGNFHASQKSVETVVETMPGVLCWRESRPIEKVGLYIPGGSAPLFSTVLMLAVPAQMAGCKEIILCTPPQADGRVHPAICFAASLTGVTSIYKIGGAQAVAAMALGTETIPQVDKIFGPGNHYVTEAKIAAQRLGVAIDLPAGPSEVLIIADQSANPQFIAADLISQAEHGPDSQSVLVTNYEPLIKETLTAIEQQLSTLPRREIATAALKNSYIVFFHEMSDCLDFSNKYAPEHLILSTEQPKSQLHQILNAGSVFLGHYSPEAAGDYASGTNHTLPTAGWARSYSGVSLDSFIKKITFQELSPEGIKLLGPKVEVMAQAESLVGHKRAISLRLKSIK
ncbi:MAG: histidinol dehydrogenase [Saprospiraceae bacterium]|nr:histidinol dehydrogenase [Saprospiraceae bacterium]